MSKIKSIAKFVSIGLASVGLIVCQPSVGKAEAKILSAKTANKTVDCNDPDLAKEETVNAYAIARYLETRILERPALTLEPMLFMDDGNISTDMPFNTDHGYRGVTKPELQRITEKASGCFAVYVDIDKGSRSKFTISARPLNKNDYKSNRPVDEAFRYDDWSLLYDSTEARYIEDMQSLDKVGALDDFRNIELLNDEASSRIVSQ